MNTSSDLAAELVAELGLTRSLGQLVASAPEIQNGYRSVSARWKNLVTTQGVDGPAHVSVVRPDGASTPLIDAVNVVDDITDGVVAPFTVSFTSAAEVTAEGAAAYEAGLVYTPGDRQALESIAHYMPVTTQALKHNQRLRSDIDTFLTSGLLLKVEDRLAAALAAASGVVAHPFDSDIATTVRTGIAAAQSAVRELGGGEVTVVLSPLDHAALDLADYDLSSWPARLVSSPAVPDGTAYIGRLKRAVILYTGHASVTVGHIDTQFTTNQVTALAAVEALPHVVAPQAIVKADLTGDVS